MTEQEILLVVGLASLAVGITLLDLLLSMVRHRRAALSRSSSPGVTSPAVDEAEVARRESVRRRLAAIESASDQRFTPAPPELRG